MSSKTQDEVDAMTVAEFDQYYRSVLDRGAEPWNHYDGPRCATCRMFSGVAAERLTNGDYSNGFGECRRYPPALIPDERANVCGDIDLEWASPIVDVNHGCGEHQPRSA
jgi:hypothetical protein